MISAIVNVWTEIMDWVVESLSSVQAVFINPTDSSLTFLGVLAVISVAIGIAFLLIGVVQNFLRLRG